MSDPSDPSDPSAAQIRLDPDISLGRLEKLRGPLEDQLTSALQAAVKKVDGQYDGEGVDQVSDELLEATKAGLHPDIAEALTPDAHQLRAVATEIVEEAEAAGEAAGPTGGIWA